MLNRSRIFFIVKDQLVREDQGKKWSDYGPEKIKTLKSHLHWGIAVTRGWWWSISREQDKQRHRGLLHTCQLALCTRYLKTTTNRQIKTKTNRDTEVCYTPVNLPSVPDIWRLFTNHLKTKTNGQAKTNRQTKTRTNSESEVCYTPVNFNCVQDIWRNRPWHVIECIMII